MADIEKFLPTCDPSLKPMAASRLGAFTPRRAIDSSGQIGWLYNAYCDEVIPILNTQIVSLRSPSRRKPSCTVNSPHLNESYSLLKRINLHHELRLGITVGLTPANGIGAITNYDGPINKYTRFLVYNYYSRTEYLPDEIFLGSPNRIHLSNPNDKATHIIALVNWGIDAVVILQLPPADEDITAIEYALRKITNSLCDDSQQLKLSDNDNAYLEKILHIETFSNTLQLAGLKSLLDFYTRIKSLKDMTDTHKPYNYNLYPLQHLSFTSDFKQPIFTTIKEQGVEKIELYILRLSLYFNPLAKEMNTDHCITRQYLKTAYEEVRAKWHNLKQMYDKEVQRIRSLVLAIRLGSEDQNKIPELLREQSRADLENTMKKFGDHLKLVNDKENTIKHIVSKGYIYQNAVDKNVKPNDDPNALEQKLSSGIASPRIICSNDDLYNTQNTRWIATSNQLLDEKQRNPQLKLIYADFSYSQYKLNDFMIFPSTQQKNDAPKQSSTTIVAQRSKSDESINILLIGESGVGKSTFINALANYLRFEHLKQAEKKPLVLMSVSFIMTIDDEFTEQVIKHEGKDTLSNEDHSHLSQSVTQHCKSYLFTLKDGQKIRIIDTPGIGDTKGINQDDTNLQHILSYINNLSHLNTICFLFKPNNTRLNIFFRSCFLQMIDLLGEKTCERIIFCFTNARSTFYTPGNTGPALKSLIGSLPEKRISFTKENTFCFDSESFRYLVAKRNGIQFNVSEEKDYEDSWTKSSTESKRLLHYIRTEMFKPLLPKESHSIKHAQLMINVIARPMLETMRNALRNLILIDEKAGKIFIELSPKIIKCTTAICLKCPRESFQTAGFWITMDSLHVFHNTCRTCLCDPSDHYSIDYELGYKEVKESDKYSAKDLNGIVSKFLEKSVDFARFLSDGVGSLENDIFLMGFERMIKEEDDICKKKNPSNMNLRLVQQLEGLKDEYKNKWKIAVKQPPIDLNKTYRRIEYIKEHWLVKPQMVAINEWHSFMLKYYEYEVAI